MRKFIQKIKDIEVITEEPGITLLGSPLKSHITTEIVKVKGKIISKKQFIHGVEIK